MSDVENSNMVVKSDIAKPLHYQILEKGLDIEPFLSYVDEYLQELSGYVVKCLLFWSWQFVNMPASDKILDKIPDSYSDLNCLESIRNSLCFPRLLLTGIYTVVSLFLVQYSIYFTWLKRFLMSFSYIDLF